ncbi:MAG: hypothetical protein ACTHJK_06820 [Sphingomicrobium sp.]
MRMFIVAAAAIATVTATAPVLAQTVNQREHRQEQRIRQGEATGQLTPREARRLQFLEARLHRTQAEMRWRNGGHLSRWQRHRLQEMANRDSAAIYRLKHNERSF